MNTFDWKILHDKVDEIISDNEYKNTIKKKKKDPLDGYIEITRNNLEDFEIGMHIKYIKKVYDLDKDIYYESVYNGGFLVDIKKGEKVYEMVLVVKSNIIWNLRFIKYKIYGKPIKNFNRSNLVKSSFRDIFEDEITKRKKELEEEQNKKINEIISKKDKYKIIFND